MPASHELAPSLADLLCTMAEEDADAETIDLEDTVWAGLLRDGADVVQRLREQIEANGTTERDEIDAEDWAALDHAFGVIVRRDSRHRTVSARAFADEEEPGRRVAGRAGVVYIGDDWTDEEAFLALPAPAVTVKVGRHPSPTAARYRIASVEDVHLLLEAVAAARVPLAPVRPASNARHRIGLMHRCPWNLT